MTVTSRHLEWVPKPFRDGDLAGGGSNRLLGRSDLSATEILIREMAQNAWDARTAGGTPTFDINLRRLGPREVGTLRRELGDSHGLGLDAVLAHEGLRGLEISDRGTTGLDGPVEIGRVTGEDTQNFVDLILKVGVPRTDGRGGGTYGFGKTAAYAYSSCGTVVYWTRCRTPEGLEHRLIASAMGPEFHLDGAEYTGRHWWGKRRSEGRTLPLRGDEAEALGEAIFTARFEGEQTGTSILILDPSVEHLSASAGRNDGGDEEADAQEEALEPAELDALFAQAARKALRLHLWPKMTPDVPGGPAPMNISLRVSGEAIDLGTPEQGAWRYWSAALRAIRRDGEGSTTGDEGGDLLSPKIVRVTRSRRPMGTLAISVRNLSIDPPDRADDLDPHAESLGTGRLMLMRGQTELIVKDKDVAAGGDLLGLDWFAVFKADSSIDADLASTEPPAHNDWLPGGAETDGERYARFLRGKLPVTLRSELSVHAPLPEQQDAADSTPLAAMLGQLLPDEPKRQKSIEGQRRKGVVKGRRGFVVTGHRLLSQGDRLYQHHMIDFIVEGPGGSTVIELSCRVASEESRTSLSLDAEQLMPEWRGAEPSAENQLLANVENGRAASVVIRTPLGRAVDVSLAPVED